MLDRLREELSNLGAAWVGAADLGALPEEMRQGMPVGVSIAVALDAEIVAELTDGPTAKYYSEYRRANALLNRLGEATAEMLQQEGHRAVAVSATVAQFDRRTLRTPLPHKTVATRAGLGWIGKCALLVTDRFGPAVRLTTVLTDAPLPVGEPVDASRCGECTKCVEVCPAGAPSGREWEAGMEREAFFDAHACCDTAGTAAAARGIHEVICGMCIAACPWTQAHIRRSRRATERKEST